MDTFKTTLYYKQQTRADYLIYFGIYIEYHNLYLFFFKAAHMRYIAK